MKNKLSVGGGFMRGMNIDHEFHKTTTREFVNIVRLLEEEKILIPHPLEGT
jgi:hypothetical protein